MFRILSLFICEHVFAQGDLSPIVVIDVDNAVSCYRNNIFSNKILCGFMISTIAFQFLFSEEHGDWLFAIGAMQICIYFWDSYSFQSKRDNRTGRKRQPVVFHPILLFNCSSSSFCRDLILSEKTGPSIPFYNTRDCLFMRKRFLERHKACR